MLSRNSSLVSSSLPISPKPSETSHGGKQNTVLVCPEIHRLETTSMVEKTSENSTLDPPERSAPTDVGRKSLTYSNIAISIPDSLEVLSPSSQVLRGSSPGRPGVEDDGSPSLHLEDTSCGEASPMIRFSTLTSTDCHEAENLKHSEENSPIRELPVVPTPARREPHRHPNTNCKIRDWDLKISKP